MIKGFIAVAGLLSAIPAAAATYSPVGPQTNVAVSTVTSGGWTLCYSSSMGTPFGTSAATTLPGCTGSNIMLAGRETGNANLLVLAQTSKLDALTATGASNNGIYTTSNGADWFYNDSWSWGFKPIGAAFSKYQCSFSAPSGSMCVHTFNFVGGYSINSVVGLNSSTAYEKLVFTSNAVPEPASWALMIAGFGLVGAAMRRRQAAILA